MNPNEATRRYYRESFGEHGDTPRGVDWNDTTSQRLRFERLVANIDSRTPFHVLDLGCGTGALYQYLCEHFPANAFQYTGVDLVQEMVELASVKHRGDNAVFVCGEMTEVKEQFDYVVASGIFNVKQEVPSRAWHTWVLTTLESMYARADKAMIFNALTAYADFSDPKLFYADPLFLVDHCMRHMSRWVTLDQSFPLYEFTLAVHRGGRAYKGSLYQPLSPQSPT